MISVLDKVLNPGIVSVACPDGNFQHELDYHGGYSPDSDLAKSMVLDLAPPLYNPRSKSKIYDRSGKGNHGMISGATWTRLPSGLWCLSFDGTDDYVDCGSDSTLDLQGDFTIELWVYLKVFASAHNVLAKRRDTVYNSYAIRIGAGGLAKPGFNASADGASWGTIAQSDDTIDILKWYHLRVIRVIATTTTTLYVNDVQKGQDITDCTPAITADSMRLSYRATGTVEPLNGYIVLAKIFNAVVPSHYQQEKYLFGG